MTDLMIFRFGKETNVLGISCMPTLIFLHAFVTGSIQKLEELCKFTIRQQWTIFEHLMSNLPRKIVEFINCDESNYEIVYPSASDID